jgi:hypothetical protein
MGEATMKNDRKQQMGQQFIGKNKEKITTRNA